MPRAWAAGSGAGWDGGGLLRVGAQVGWVRGGESTYRPHRCCQPTPQQASESPAAAPRPRGPASGLRPARVRGTSPARADGPVRVALPGRCKATRKVLYPLKLAVHKSSDTGKQAWLAACTEQGVCPQLSAPASLARCPCRPLPAPGPHGTGCVSPQPAAALGTLGPCEVLQCQAFHDEKEAVRPFPCLAFIGPIVFTEWRKAFGRPGSAWKRQ